MGGWKVQGSKGRSGPGARKKRWARAWKGGGKSELCPGQKKEETEEGDR